jgi:GTP pyrophosphokinase
MTMTPDSTQPHIERLLKGRPPAETLVLSRAAERVMEVGRSQPGDSRDALSRQALAVAEILNDLRLDYETLTAAILHAGVEASEITLQEVESLFGPVIARLVDGVTKLDRLGEFCVPGEEGVKELAQAESLRKLLLAMAEDVRVVLITLAQRLHTLRTLKSLDRAQQRRIARETLDIYAPLANRLGVWQIKWELEDFSLRYLDPEVYQELAARLDEKRRDREAYIRRVVERLNAALREAGIEAVVSGRPKHIYSIWRKMQRKRVDFEQIFDMRAVRILVKQERDCYGALGVVHGLWRHIAKEFDDYIANPKENLYRSLHTAVIGPEGRTLEVQIRTEEMHRHAELGVAAHWRYKEGGSFDPGYEEKIAWLRQLLEWRDEEGSAGDFVDRFRSEAFQERVYVLTPQGRIIDLPQGATPLDFAYAVHSEIGHRCRGAKVNGRIVPLTYPLQNGEQVEVLTTKSGTPSRDWLSPHQGYLKTSRARSRVRQWFKRQDIEYSISAGRSLLERELHRLGISGLPVERIAAAFGHKQVEDLLTALGRGDINTGQLASAIGELVPRPETPATEKPRVKLRTSAATPEGITILGVGNLLTSMARCCHPVPNDPIVGYITRGRGVTIHRRDCGNILRMEGEDRHRLIEVQWGKPSEAGYAVELFVEAYDRSGLLRDITAVLANEKINLTGVNTVTDKEDGIARMSLVVEIANIAQLSRLLSQIGQIPNVVEARRKV